MKVLLGIHGVCDVVDPGLEDAKKNNIVKGLLFQLILEDLILQVGNLTRKEMWEEGNVGSINTRNLRVDRMKEERLQTLITEFENMKMSDNGTIDEYATNLSGIASKSATLGEVTSEHKLKESKKANDAQEKLLYAKTENSNKNSDSNRGRGRGSYSRGHGRRHGQGQKFMPPKIESNTEEDDVWLRDDSCMSINEKGLILFQRKNGDFLTMHDSVGSLLNKVPRIANRLYKTQLKVRKPYCLQANINEESWLGHVRLGRIRFGAVNLMHKLARGVPVIKHQRATRKGWKIHHLDVKTDFLHGDLKEEVISDSSHNVDIDDG
nr:uncharacterized protein [Tanacetum cinerariifolium]